jgi:hypothetical protein
MRETIYLERIRFSPVFEGATFESLIGTWEAAQDYFSDYVFFKGCTGGSESIIDGINISLDASEIIDELKQMYREEQNILEENEKAIEQLSSEQMVERRYRLVLNIDANDEISFTALFNILGMFWQELFLAMNISGGPCLDLTYTKYILPEKWPSPERYPLPSISFFHFEVGWLKAADLGWPQIQIIEFNNAWTWLDQIGIRGLEIAKQGSQKALFNILYLESSHSAANPSDIILMAQAIESLFSTTKENILSTLKERIFLLHGQPANHKNWINKFYDLRSRIIHGDHPVVRPPSLYNFMEAKEYGEKYWPVYSDSTVMAFLVIIVTIQDLIKNSAKGYTFKETIEKIGCEQPET